MATFTSIHDGQAYFDDGTKLDLPEGAKVEIRPASATKPRAWRVYYDYGTYQPACALPAGECQRQECEGVFKILADWRGRNPEPPPITNKPDLPDEPAADLRIAVAVEDMARTLSAVNRQLGRLSKTVGQIALRKKGKKKSRQ